MDRRTFFTAIGTVGATSLVPTAALAEVLEHRGFARSVCQYHRASLQTIE